MPKYLFYCGVYLAQGFVAHAIYEFTHTQLDLLDQSTHLSTHLAELTTTNDECSRTVEQTV